MHVMIAVLVIILFVLKNLAKPQVAMTNQIHVTSMAVKTVIPYAEDRV
jgi:hypothetical protein